MVGQSHSFNCIIVHTQSTFLGTEQSHDSFALRLPATANFFFSNLSIFFFYFSLYNFFTRLPLLFFFFLIKKSSEYLTNGRTYPVIPAMSRMGMLPVKIVG